MMAIEGTAVVQDYLIRHKVNADIAMPQIAVDKGGLQLPSIDLHGSEQSRNDLFTCLVCQPLQLVVLSLDLLLKLDSATEATSEELFPRITPGILKLERLGGRNGEAELTVW